jgi:hypothetical protein
VLDHRKAYFDWLPGLLRVLFTTGFYLLWGFGNMTIKGSVVMPVCSIHETLGSNSSTPSKITTT